MSSQFESEVLAFYLGTAERSFDNGAVVTPPPLPPGIPKAHVLGTTRWKGSLKKCRQTMYTDKGEGLSGRSILGDIYGFDLTLPGGTSAIAFAPNKIKVTPGGARSTMTGSRKECAWWSPSAKTWKKDGCTYIEASDKEIGGSCACTHLTDFIIAQSEIATEIAAAEPSVAYLGLAGVFGFVILFSLTRIRRLCKDDERSGLSQRREFMLLLINSIVRLLSCVFFFKYASSTEPQAILMAVGGCLSFMNFAHLQFMWVTAYHTAYLCTSDFKK
jgi:hypothetical protein